jgi:hypothetical protein
MWIPKEELDALKERISTLEKEQVAVRSYIRTCIESDKELLRVVKKLNSDFNSIIQNNER